MENTANKAAYNPDNIFARILRGEIPAVSVYEDADTLAFMDVMPQSKGHILAIPKAPSRNLLDAEPQTLQQLILVVQKLARAAQKAFKADGISIKQFNEPAAGQSVFYLHFHIIPRYNGVALKGHKLEPAAKEELEAGAAKMRAALQG